MNPAKVYNRMHQSKPGNSAMRRQTEKIAQTYWDHHKYWTRSPTKVYKYKKIPYTLQTPNSTKINQNKA